MLREANNYVKIEGILNEVALNYTSYPKNGKTVEAISGVIYVRVEQTINGEEQTLIVPVHMFSNRLKNNGEPNPAYTSIEKVMKEFVSIAASSYEQAYCEPNIRALRLFERFLLLSEIQGGNGGYG